jgi:hypothetical protein
MKLFKIGKVVFPQLHYVGIQHYRKIQQSTATPCGNTTL